MYQKDFQQKFNLILAKFGIDQQYANKFFSDFEFAKKELANVGLQMDIKLYDGLGYSYKRLNSVSVKSETFEKHWNALTYNQSCIEKPSFLTGLKIYMLYRFLKLHLKFRDRLSAAHILASILKTTVRDKNQQDIIVLGIPRGGIIIADIVARELSADLDIIIVTKLGHPQKREQAIGAVVLEEDGNITKVINQRLVDESNIPQEYLEEEKSAQIQELKRRISLYAEEVRRGSKVKDKTAILVDDGIATGSTIIAAARSIKKQEPKHLIIAAPIASRETVELIKQEVDAVEVVTTPSSTHFNSIGQFYQNFEPVMADQVIQILRNRSQ
jgi:putative phosphoribosyl transferase